MTSIKFLNVKHIVNIQVMGHQNHLVDMGHRLGDMEAVGMDMGVVVTDK